MKIPQHKDDWFQKSGFREPLNELDMAIADFDEDANAQNAPRKEVAIIMATKKQEVPVEKADMPPDEDEKEEDVVEKEVPAYVTREEVADVVVELVKGSEDALSLLPQIVKSLEQISQRLDALEADDSEKISRAKEELPPASLQAIIAERLLREDKPDGNLARHNGLLDKKPFETEDDRPINMNGLSRGLTGIPVLDAQIKGGK